MSSTANLVERLRELGGELLLDGDRIRYRIPAGSQEARQVLAEIRRDRDAVMALLKVSPALPTKRCYACRSWLYWISIYGAVTCAICHPPANAQLVREWYWLPEGECKREQ